MTKKKLLTFGCLGTIVLFCILIYGIPAYFAQIRLSHLQQPPSSFPLSEKWQVTLGHASHDAPTYRAGLLFLPGDTASGVYWYGVEAKTGKVVWSRRTSNILTRLVNLRTYHRCLTEKHLVISGQLSILVLDPLTGDLLWQKSKGSRATCSNDLLFVSACPRCGISAMELPTGAYRWRGTTYLHQGKELNGFTLYDQFYNPVSGDIIARAATGSAGYYTVDSQTGAVLTTLDDWLLQHAYAPANGRGFRRNPVYIVDRGELFMGGTVLDAVTYQILHKEDRYIPLEPPTVTENTIYLGDSTERLGKAGFIALDRATYEVKWTYNSSLTAFSQMAILNGIGYVIFSDATLRAFDLETGQELGYWQPPPEDLAYWPVCNYEFYDPFCLDEAWVGLATSENTLFVSFGDGKLYAFGQ